MTTLTSKIDGMQMWAYDIARRPNKANDNNGLPQLSSYTQINEQNCSINPVTQNPTENLNQPVNIFRYVCDANHVSNGNSIQSHGVKFSTSDSLDQQLTTTTNYSFNKYVNAIFADDDIYIQAPDSNTVTRAYTKKPFTTSTPGINIVYQTGIVSSNQGFGLLIFEVLSGYKIPVNTTVQANNMTRNPNTGRPITGKPETFPVTIEITPGLYEMTLLAPALGWSQCDIDFATVQDTTTPTPPTTPTTPSTIPFVQTLTNAKSNITGTSIDRKLNAISLTADTGYVFQNTIQVSFYSGGQVVSEYNVDGGNTDTITIPLNTTTENTITDKMDNVKLIATATLPTTETGYEHNYLITDTELSAFSHDQILTGTSETGIQAYDVSPYIDNLIELPFVVTTDSVVNRIIVGKKQSNVVSHETKNRFVTLDLGYIKIPAKYSNGYDYQNKTIKLFTPFVPPISINNENAIENTIHIVYKIDISNGNLTVNLYNDDVLFFTGINNIASQLPFFNRTKNTIISRNSHFNDNDIRQPYLVITREEPILNNDYYPTIERGAIKNYNGNVRVRLLNNMNIPNNELSDLARQLESGVNHAKSNWRIK